MRHSRLSTASIACLALLLLGLVTAASAYQYNSQTQVTSNKASVQPGGQVQLTATVQPGCPPFESCAPFTGTVTWDDGDVGGVFQTPTCTYRASDNLSVGECITTYTAPAVPGPVAIMASYSGNANYSSSSGGVTIQVLGSTTQSTTSSSTSTSSTGASSGGFDPSQLLLYGGVAAAVVVVAVLVLRMRKPL